MTFLKYLLTLLLFTLLIPSGKAWAIDKITLQLQWKNQFEFAGFYAAKEKGFYRDSGLDVSFVEYSSQVNIVDTVLANKAQYGLSYSSIIADYLNGKPIVMLANFFKQSPLVLITQKEITTPAGLKGKKVMGVSDSIDNITLLTMLEKFNVSLNDIQTVPATFTIDDFINKKVDAMSVFTTNELYDLMKKGQQYNIFDPTMYGTKYYDVNLFTSQKELQKHPDRVKRFTQASIKGWKYALAHKEEIVDLILSKYNTQHKSKKALIFEAEQINQIMLPKIYPIGSIDPYRIKMIAESFKQAGFIKVEKQRDLDKFIYNKSPSILTLTVAERAFIKKHPTIVLGTEKEWKPYVIVNSDGTISGYDSDVLKLINEVSGSHFVLEAGNWQTMQERAKQKEIDGLSTGGIHEERKSYLNFSDIYITMRKLLLVSKENPKNIISLDDLAGKTIAIHKSNLVDEKISQKFPKSTILKLDSVEEVITAVVTGKADAMFGNGATIYLANEIGMPYLKQVAKLDDKLELAFGIRKDWLEAISIINKALAYIGERRLLEIKSRWFWQELATTMDTTLQALNLSDTEKKYIKEKPIIPICVDPDWMPLEKIEKGKHIGLSAELLKLVSSKTGIEFQLIPTQTWSESISKLKNGNCILTPMVMQTDSRKEFINVTTPYADLPLVIATTIDKFFIRNIGELSGEKVGFVKNYAFGEILKQRHSNIDFIEVESVKDGLEKVKQGELYAFVDILSTIGYQIQRHFPTQLKIAGEIKEQWRLGIGVRKQESILYGIMQKGVAALSQHEKDKLLNTWISIKYEKGVDYVQLWLAIGVFIFIGLLLLYRQKLLSNYNRKLKAEVTQQIEELRKKDEILITKLRMAAMGEMLSMIAHQWRQPLSVISSALLGIEIKLKSGKYNLDVPKERKAFLKLLEKKHQNILDHVDYLSSTVDDFRNFFKPNKKQEYIMLSLPVERALSIVENSMKNNGITVHKKIISDSKIMLYQNEVMQAVINLLKNCEDHFKEKKIINPVINISIQSKGTTHHISVCDNGGGVSEEIIDRVFDPYFSTKNEKNGTGLGLYMSKLIIEKHHQGKLKVRNSEGGACFDIIFGESNLNL